jgi:hypothetical protein
MVAFLPGLSARILRKKPVQYSHIRLDPIRTTSSPAARILHAVLSNRIRVGRKAKYSLEKLLEIVYLPSTSTADMRKRKASTRTAIKELASAGWEFRQASATSQEVLEIHHVGNTESLNVGQMGSTPFPSVQIMTGRISARRFAHDPSSGFVVQPRQSHQVSTTYW